MSGAALAAILGYAVGKRRRGAAAAPAADPDPGMSEEARAIIATAYDAYVAIDRTSTILEWNLQAERTFGWTRDEAIGRNMAELIVPEHYRAAHQHGVQRYLDTGEGPVLNQRIELSALHRDGHEFPVELTIWPTRIQGELRFHAFLHDISDRHRGFWRLTAQTAAAEALVASASLAEAAPKVLAAVCTALGWRTGALWIADEEGASCAAWSSGTPRLQGTRGNRSRSSTASSVPTATCARSRRVAGWS